MNDVQITNIVKSNGDYDNNSPKKYKVLVTRLAVNCYRTLTRLAYSRLPQLFWLKQTTSIMSTCFLILWLIVWSELIILFRLCSKALFSLSLLWNSALVLMKHLQLHVELSEVADCALRHLKVLLSRAAWCFLMPIEVTNVYNIL